MRHLGTMSKILSVNEASPDWTNPNSRLDIDLTSGYESRLCWKAASWERMEVSKMKNFWQLLSIVVCTAIAEVPGLPIVLFEFKTAREYNQWWFVCFTLLHIVALWFKSLSSHWKCRRRAPEDQCWVAEICRNCMTPHTRLKKKYGERWPTSVDLECWSLVNWFPQIIPNSPSDNLNTIPVCQRRQG